MSSNLPLILNLIAAIQTNFRQHKSADDAVNREIAKVLSLLEVLPPLEGSFPRSSHPVTRHLDAAFASGSDATEKLLSAIRPVAYDLPWKYNYARRDDAPGLENTMGFAEIIGPEAPFRSKSVCLGLTLIGAETLYPTHFHPAIELYYVTAGTATWTADGSSRDKAPGTYILHPSKIVHAMRTHKEPLLAVYSWSGDDVETLSSYSEK